MVINSSSVLLWDSRSQWLNWRSYYSSGYHRFYKTHLCFINHFWFSIVFNMAFTKCLWFWLWNRLFKIIFLYLCNFCFHCLHSLQMGYYENCLGLMWCYYFLQWVHIMWFVLVVWLFKGQDPSIYTTILWISLERRFYADSCFIRPPSFLPWYCDFLGL